MEIKPNIPKCVESGKTMGDRSHMTSLQKTIAYSAIVTEILAILSAFGSSIHIAFHVFTTTGLTKLYIFTNS